jgi:geranylgeranyl reductase family protein
MTLAGTSDVLIIGAGPCGCAAGIQLARAGWNVAVVDSARFPRDKVCGDALSPEAARLITQLGASAAIHSNPHAVYTRGAAIFPDGTRIERMHRHPGYIVPRRHLDFGLVEALREAGAQVFEEQRVAALERDRGAVCGARGPGLNWSARLVIASDGYSSLSNKQSVRPPVHGNQIAVSATAYFSGVSFPQGTDISEHFFEHDLALGYAWIFPPVDELSNVGVYMRSDAYVKCGIKLPELLNRFMARHPDRFRNAVRQSDVRSWPLPLAPREQAPCEPGLLLAGDAAGMVDPLSGEGIWQALSSGMLAASIAAEALQAGELSEPLRARYASACARQFARPGRRKLWAQEANEFIMQHRLFRRPLVRTLLQWGWNNPLFDLQGQPASHHG